jgi:non-specific serine/threonine protein kinase/serine/threonine-protein kinase
MRLSDLSPQRWKQLQRIAGEVMDAPPAQRDAVLEEQCSGDTVLRSAALELLKDFSETTGLLGFAPPLAAGLGSVRTGTRIGAYRIIRELGQGGMGTVYLAARDDGAFDKQVALKTIPRFGGQALFARERQILARLEHPGIARLLDGGTTGDGTQFLAMEFVDGVEITAYAAGRPVQEILGLFLQVCGAIRYAHQNLVIHRDLKPANILVTAAGVAKVLDFGIAKLLEDGADTAMTQAVMTPAWASPEQRAGAPANTLSDVYSLGLILYRLLTGVLPKAGEPIARPSQWRPELAGDLDSILLKALAGDTAHRYSSVEQCSADIERHLAGKPVEARNGTWWYRAAKFARRRKGTVGAAAAFLLVMGLGAAGTFTQKDRAERHLADVKALARAVMFEYQDDLAKLPGSTGLRAKIARDTVQYLDRIATDAGSDDALLHEVALAYRRVGEIQGYSRVANLGAPDEGIQSLRKSEALLNGLAARREARPETRMELGVTLERLANVLSNAGRNAEAQPVAERAVAALTEVGSEAARAPLTRALGELSAIVERRGQHKLGIELARKAVQYAEGLRAEHRDEQALAYGRLAAAIATGDRVSPEAMKAVAAGLALYGRDGEACGPAATAETMCRITYLQTLDVMGRTLYYASRLEESIALNEKIEREAEALARRDPNDRTPLRQMRTAQTRQGLAWQSLYNREKALEKYRQSIETSQRITASDPTNWEGACLTIHSRAKYAEILIQNTSRVAEAEGELKLALALSDRTASDSLPCLDQRKIVLINLARVAEKKGDLAGGMQWRRETVRVARRYAGITPGEPLGMIIEAGANFELGLGGLEAAEKFEDRAYLAEAGRALDRSLDIYKELKGMGNPLQYQFDGWPERAAKMRKRVEAANKGE